MVGRSSRTWAAWFVVHNTTLPALDDSHVTDPLLVGPGQGGGGSSVPDGCPAVVVEEVESLGVDDRRSREPALHFREDVLDGGELPDRAAP